MEHEPTGLIAAADLKRSEDFRGMLIDLRNARRMKQFELAEALGFTPQYLCDIELGRRLGSVELTNRICEFVKANGKKRREWHAAAARAHGWDV